VTLPLLVFGEHNEAQAMSTFFTSVAGGQVFSNQAASTVARFSAAKFLSALQKHFFATGSL
jgi:hypothetical protein